MTVSYVATIRCDHLGCEAEIEGGPIAEGRAAHIRSAARKVAWLVAKAHHGRFHDYCPEHAAPYRAARR